MVHPPPTVCWSRGRTFSQRPHSPTHLCCTIHRWATEKTTFSAGTMTGLDSRLGHAGVLSHSPPGPCGDTPKCCRWNFRLNTLLRSLYILRIYVVYCDYVKMLGSVEEFMTTLTHYCICHYILCILYYICTGEYECLFDSTDTPFSL